MTNQNLGRSAQDVLQKINNEVADFILDTLKMNDPQRQSDAPWNGMLFSRIRFSRDEIIASGDIQITPNPSGSFEVYLRRCGHVETSEVLLVDGPKLEDLLIELADI